jgi:hypothetical protein
MKGMFYALGYILGDFFTNSSCHPETYLQVMFQPIPLVCTYTESQLRQRATGCGEGTRTEDRRSAAGSPRLQVPGMDFININRGLHFT